MCLPCTVYCTCHNLVAKTISDSLHRSLDVAFESINKIKNHALNDGLFRQLCGENEESFERLLFHTELHWLAKGNCLARLCELFDLGHRIPEEGRLWSCRHDVFYLSDFFGKMIEVSLKLQGDGVTLIHSRATMRILLAKLELFGRNLSRRQFNNFPQLTKVG